MADDEAVKIKDAFKQYDQNGDGNISFDELTNVMRACGEFSDEELKEMFESVDVSGDGKISYNEFVDWVMAAQDGSEGDAEEAAPAEDAPAEDTAVEGGGDAEAGADAEAGGDAEGGNSGTVDDPEDGSDWYDEGEFEEELEDVDSESMGSVTRPEWRVVMSRWDVDADEADGMFAQIAQQYDPVPEDGLPVQDFVYAFGFEGDNEVLKALTTAIAEAKEAAPQEAEAPAEGEDPAPRPIAPNTIKKALDRIVRHMNESSKAVEEGPAIAKDSEFLSKTEISALEAMPDDELIEKVKATQGTPPLLSSTAGTQSCSERCKAKVNALIAKHKEEGTKFTDPEWDTENAADSVLWVDKVEPGYDCTVAKPAAWKRLSEIVENPVLCKEGASANDIIQGSIGSCFLLGAMGAIVGTDPKALKHIFISYDFEVGIFAVRFCVEGEWVYVLVDDIMPVNADGKLLYCSSKDPEECWAPLLEKAYCKLHTCYEMCDGGLSQEAIFSFFGGVNGIFKITDKHRADPSSYFKVLKGARGHGYMLTTGFSGRPSGGQGRCGEAMLPCGLIGGHAYSVMKLREAEGNKLVCCRNPWGQGEWTGKWGDNNAQGEWTDEMNAATGHKNEKDGTFWMSIEDFVTNSAGVEYARAFGPQWKKTTQYNEFQKGSMACTAQWAYQAASEDELSLTAGEEIEVLDLLGGWWKGKASAGEGYFPANYVKLKDRPVAKYSLAGDAGCKAVVMLLQPNQMYKREWYKRKEDGKNYKNTAYPGMLLTVIGADGKKKFKKMGASRCHWGEVTLPEDGSPLNVFAMSSDGKGTRFSIRVYVKGGSATLTGVEGGTLAEIKASLGEI